MANGHFNVAAEVIAPASMAFVGNVDDSIEQLVASEQFDLCKPLPKEFDMAVIHRFHAYVPGWEIPPNSSKLLTRHYGLITDYLAEAFHHLFGKVNLFTATKTRLNLNSAHEGRDETAVIKTVAAFTKLLHPGGTPTDDELQEYLVYAIELRRRVKEQLNKRKSDDEFAQINLGYIAPDGTEVIVSCPESQGIDAMLAPGRPPGAGKASPAKTEAPAATTQPTAEPPSSTSAPFEGQRRIYHDDMGFSYQQLFGDHLRGAKKVTLEDPFVRTHHQIVNFLRFAEVCVGAGSVESITLITSTDDEEQKREAVKKLKIIETSLQDHGITLNVTFKNSIHDRVLTTDTGWAILLGRGLDMYQPPEDWLEVGANSLDLRKCRETTITYARVKPPKSATG
jgi:ATP-dependent Lon protease